MVITELFCWECSFSKFQPQRSQSRPPSRKGKSGERGSSWALLLLSGCFLEAFQNTHPGGQQGLCGEPFPVPPGAWSRRRTRVAAPGSGKGGQGRRQGRDPLARPHGAAAPHGPCCWPCPRGALRRRGGAMAASQHPKPGGQSNSAAPLPAAPRCWRPPVAAAAADPPVRGGARRGGGSDPARPRSPPPPPELEPSAGRSRTGSARHPRPARSRLAVAPPCRESSPPLRPRSRCPRAACEAGLGPEGPQGLQPGPQRDPRAACPGAPWGTAGRHGLGESIRAASLGA